MNLNFIVDLNKLQKRQAQKAKTGMSMQNVVNNALNLPQNNPPQPMTQPTKNDGWGANIQ
jgi:hypothetical protein